MLIGNIVSSSCCGPQTDPYSFAVVRLCRNAYLSASELADMWDAFSLSNNLNLPTQDSLPSFEKVCSLLMHEVFQISLTVIHTLQYIDQRLREDRMKTPSKQFVTKPTAPVSSFTKDTLHMYARICAKYGLWMSIVLFSVV